MERENERMRSENAELRSKERLPGPAAGDPGDADPDDCGPEGPIESEMEGWASRARR